MCCHANVNDLFICFMLTVSATNSQEYEILFDNQVSNCTTNIGLAKIEQNYILTMAYSCTVLLRGYTA